MTSLSSEKLPIKDAEITWRAELPAAGPGAIALGKYWHVLSGELTIDMPGVARYRITGGNRIEVALFPGGERSVAEFFLMSTPFGALIHQRGELALHASAVFSPACGKALLIAGISGSGKSTAAAALAQRGWAVLNDDVSRITLRGKEPVVWPGFCALKLWRQSCRLLNLEGETLVRTRGGKEKYFWPGKTAAQSHAVPIAALVELISGNEMPVRLERMTGRQILEAYFRHTFRQPLVEALGCRVPHFRHIAQLASAVPAYRLKGNRQLRPNLLADQLNELLIETVLT
jgi:hypothetical protein